MGKKKDRVKLDSPEAFAQAATRIGAKVYFDDMIDKDGNPIRVIKDINLQHLAITEFGPEAGILMELDENKKLPHLELNVKAATRRIEEYEWMEETKACVKNSRIVTPK